MLNNTEPYWETDMLFGKTISCLYKDNRMVARIIPKECPEKSIQARVYWAHFGKTLEQVNELGRMK